MPSFNDQSFFTDAFDPLAYDFGSEVIPEVEEEGQTPAGRKKQREYVVEIDGREFTTDSLQEALSLLAKAEALARLAADKRAEQVVFDSLPKAIRVGKANTVKISVPKITGPKELRDDLAKTKARIKQIYRDAAITAELRILMALETESDDEEALLLSI